MVLGWVYNGWMGKRWFLDGSMAGREKRWFWDGSMAGWEKRWFWDGSMAE
jgi:hypothetical protein